jgi:hypothetical protein
MPHEALHDAGADAGLIGKGRHLATEGVEIEHQSRGVPVGDPGGLQVGPEHLRSLPLGQREHGGVGRQGRHEGPQIARQVAREGQGRRVAVLRVAGLYRNAGGLPIERRGPDAGDLGIAESGRCGQPVAEGAGRAGHRLEGGAALGGLDEPGQLIEGKGPAVVPAVFLRVEAGQSLERILSQPAGPLAPSGKAAGGGPVVVAGLGRSAGVPERRQGGLNAFGREVRQPGLDHQSADRRSGLLMAGSAHRLAVDVVGPGSEHHGDEPAHPIGTLIGMLRRVALMDHALSPGIDVLRQGPGGMGGVLIGLGVDDPAAAKIGLALQLAGHRLGRGLVGASPLRPPHAIGVHIGDVPRCQPVPLVAGPLEHARHDHFSFPRVFRDRNSKPRTSARTSTTSSLNPRSPDMKRVNVL